MAAVPLLLDGVFEVWGDLGFVAMITLRRWVITIELLLESRAQECIGVASNK